jgi:hypothetical protein
MNKNHSISRLSVYFDYTRDACYKSSTVSEKEVLSREVLMTSVRSIRKTHPRMGGKKYIIF